MANHSPNQGFHPDVEALVRSASELPTVSPDLRPRVIEAAVAAGQRRWQRRRALAVAAVALVFVGVPPPAVHSPDGISIGHRADQEAGEPGQNGFGDQLLATSVRRWGGAGAACDWEHVDNFTRLRRDYLRMLRQAF